MSTNNNIFRELIGTNNNVFNDVFKELIGTNNNIFRELIGTNNNGVHKLYKRFEKKTQTMLHHFFFLSHKRFIYNIILF
jgi:hypothetical protein